MTPGKTTPHNPTRSPSPELKQDVYDLVEKIADLAPEKNILKNIINEIFLQAHALKLSSALNLFFQRDDFQQLSTMAKSFLIHIVFEISNYYKSSVTELKSNPKAQKTSEAQMKIIELIYTILYELAEKRIKNSD